MYLIILLLPTYQIRFKVAGIPMTFLEGMILILAIVEFSSRVLSFPRRRESSEWIPRSSRGMTLFFIFLFLLAALISVSTGPNLAKAAGIFKAYFFEAVLFCFLVLLIIDTQKKLRLLFKALTILALYLSIFGIYQFITLHGLPYNWWAVDVESRRIVSVLNHPNALALLLGPLLAMLIFLPYKKKLEWLTITLAVVTLYLSFSRASWLALITTIIVFTLVSWLRRYVASWRGERLKERSRLGLKLTAVTLGIIFIIIIIPFSRTKILDLARGQDPSQQNRYVLWSAAADMLKKNPFLGVGLMGFHEAYKNYPLGPDQVVQNYPHNFFLNFWVETGLLGLISIIGLLILFFKKVTKLLSTATSGFSPPARGGDEEGVGERSQMAPFALAAAAGMSMIILHGLVDVSYFKNDLSVLFWLIYSLPFLSLRA